MDQQYGAGRAWRWNLGTGKWATRPQASEHGTQAAREEWRGRRVDGCFLTGFPPMCRSALCASEFEVSGWRRAARKSHRRRGDLTAAAAAAAEGSGMRIK